MEARRVAIADQAEHPTRSQMFIGRYRVCLVLLVAFLILEATTIGIADAVLMGVVAIALGRLGGRLVRRELSRMGLEPSSSLPRRDREPT
jgi:hypothetical protein